MFKNLKPLKPVIVFVIAALIVILAFMANVLGGILVSLVMLILLVYVQWPTLLTLRGQQEYSKGNYNKALSLLRRAHNSSRSKVYSSTSYAYILLRCGQPDEAKKVLNYVLLNRNLKPEEKAQARQILSLVHYKQKDYEEANRLMELVFETYKNSSVYGALGYYKILSKSEDALSFNLEAYDYNSDDKVIMDNLIQLYIESGELEKAKELSDKTLKAGNSGIEIYYHAGQIELAMGNREAALEFFQKAQSCPRSFMTAVSEEELNSQLALLQQS